MGRAQPYATRVSVNRGGITRSDPNVPPGRAALEERWLDLTRTRLPMLARRTDWPIRFDHCFMRVCLDAACGRPWQEVIRRPARRNAGFDTLARAIEVAERIAADPAILPALNVASLRMRGKTRQPKVSDEIWPS